jgi:hypothetical protein
MTERVRSVNDGLDVIDQPNAECCYVRADKYWVRDQDGVMWEMYTAHEDIESHSAADRDVTAAEGCCFGQARGRVPTTPAAPPPLDVRLGRLLLELQNETPRGDRLSRGVRYSPYLAQPSKAACP